MPKPRGSHRLHKLSAVSIPKLQTGFHSDGGGLYLKVDKSGARRWVARLHYDGKSHDIGLGGFPVIKLAEAREKAVQARAIARSGDNPLQVLRLHRSSVSFEQAARQWYAENQNVWTNSVHRRQVIQSLEDNAFPRIGGLPINKIEKSHIHNVLSPIWTSKNSVAKRLKSWLARILDWAHAKGFREEYNPCQGIEKGLPKVATNAVSHKSLEWKKVPDFLTALQASQSIPSVKTALTFLILTAARTIEVRGATWEEIDADRAIWRIPADRMKTKKAHVVPLNDEMLRALRAVAPPNGEERTGLVFRGLGGKALSENTLLKVTKSFDTSLTVHGFRSSFRTWAADTGQPFEVAEAALAHQEKSRVVRAYQRSDMIDRRRAMMAAWAEHCCNQ